jgi:hypothetical protein
MVWLIIHNEIRISWYWMMYHQPYKKDQKKV